MKISRIAAAGCILLLAVSCAKTAGIKGTITGASDDEVIVKLLEVNSYNVLDTVKTDKSGSFSYKIELAKGKPEFIYLFHKDTKIASLLLEQGDKVSFTADTLGNYSVEGSEESSRLLEVENSFAEFAGHFKDISDRMDAEGLDEAAMRDLQKQITKLYIDYYRKATAYVLSNSHSLTCVPVLFQSVNEYFPIFSQQTDAILFRATADSLKSVYPESRYVQALEKEAARRESILQLNGKLNNASETGYLNLSLPNEQGRKVTLSDVDSKVTLIHFWSASDAAQKMFNLEILLPIYKEFHDKGFEIYAICTDVDKSMWASVVKSQELPWINVCDGLGASSPALLLYRVTQLPCSFVIVDGAITDETITGEAGLRKILQQNLK
ncbi:MAG: AhpC/TSA family protein [Bacteroidales bacterium]|nr:AhpC/TSA family protein [Bacteroidales bacterium]